MDTSSGTLDSETVARLVAEHYDVGPITGSRHLFSSVNHTYAVEAESDCYAVRVHAGKKWWISSEADLLFELDLLDHLHARGVPVSYSLPGRDGQRLRNIDTPMGRRYLVLFSWAPGAPSHDTHAKAFRVGATMAAIHVAADTFRTGHPRYRLDLSTLLQRHLDKLELDCQRPSDVSLVHRHIAEIRQRIADFDPGRTGWGIIHGDVQGLNFHFDGADRITFLDFDLCGYGWRAYEIAYYYTRIRKHLRGALIRGYESVRPLTVAEHDMLPTFGRLAWIREGCQSADLVYRMRRPYMSFA